MEQDTIHIEDSNGSDGGEEEYHADQYSPQTCPNVNKSRVATRIDWPWGEILGPDNLAHDRDATAPIHTDSGDL